jgi:serine/arginine repetitive matrix protein 1
MMNRNQVTVTSKRKEQKDPAWKVRLPSELMQPVNLKEVRVEVCKPTLASKLVELLGLEDEIVSNFFFELLDSHSFHANARHMYSHLVTFLESNTLPFLHTVWALLREAQESPDGIPPSLVHSKQSELRTERANTAATAATTATTATAAAAPAAGGSENTAHKHAKQSSDDTREHREEQHHERGDRRRRRRSLSSSREHKRRKRSREAAEDGSEAEDERNDERRRGERERRRGRSKRRRRSRSRSRESGGVGEGEAQVQSVVRRVDPDECE